MENLSPHKSEIDPKKLSSSANVITDTCNEAQKLRRILVDTIVGCYEYDCMHHLRNVWFGNMEKKLTKKLNALLRSDLDEFDPRLRVTASISVRCCAPLTRSSAFLPIIQKDTVSCFLSGCKKHILVPSCFTLSVRPALGKTCNYSRETFVNLSYILFACQSVGLWIRLMN